MDFSDPTFLFASLIWGSVASGYVIYGMKQRSVVPFVAGVLMTVASFFASSALIMSLISIGLMVAAYWVGKNYF